MKRIAIKIDSNLHEKTLFFMDVPNGHLMLPYLFNDDVAKEFKEIRDVIKEGIRNREKYCKCDVSDKAKDMFEMRFIKNGRNDRIYCKEFSISGKRYIVMVELFEGKKSQHIPKQIKSRIETMGGYEYEFKA